MQYNVGIIGCGNIAAGFNSIFSKWPVTHIAAYNEYPSTNVVAVADINIKKARECADKWKVPGFYCDYEEMLKREKLDIISVCTPYKSHAQIIKDIVKFSASTKAIFCEKPFTNNLNEAKEVTELCQEKEIILLVNFQRRHDRFYSYVKENMNLLVGEVKKVIFTYAGGIINNGSHAFDLLRYYFGEIKNLKADYDKQGDDPVLSVFLEFGSGLKGLITSCEIPNHSSFGLIIIGTKARLDLINKPLFEYSYRYFKHKESDIVSNVTYSSSEQSWPIKRDFERDVFVRAVDDIIKVIEEGKKPESSAENGLAALELVSAAIVSAREGNKEIKLPFSSSLELPKIESLFKQWKKN